ncbi:hypothetical protein BJ508DRAFT_417851 [Ascobolus immersus RN42]|uniref:Hemerythrin-like domain-containing protein n=1 Tax=Ascobolus immersus RN42 TaxID=1160509 RepID=A0A3N4HTX0_ASCIM|nr:hypothetical protein BJ508DRAFT_417851 [Ascobolus immersus RN42]
MSTSSPAECSAKESQGPPPLSGSDFRTYNRLSQKMDAFHNHFRSQWTSIKALTSAPHSTTKSTRTLLPLLHSFISTLTLHHNIEETHVFPLLATRMPEFRDDEIMKSQHKVIHDGLEELAKVAGIEKDVEAGMGMGGWGWEEDEGRWEGRKASEDVRKKVGEVMDGFEKVLWSHLDGEVKALGAENMRKYWSLDEIRRFPM